MFPPTPKKKTNRLTSCKLYRWPDGAHLTLSSQKMWRPRPWASLLREEPHGPAAGSERAGGFEKAWWLLSLPFVTSKVCPSQALTRTCCELTSGHRAPRAGFDVSQALCGGAGGSEWQSGNAASLTTAMGQPQPQEGTLEAELGPL